MNFTPTRNHHQTVRLHPNLFISEDGSKFGLSNTTIDVHFYRSLFEELRLTNVGFGHNFFPDSDQSWIHWNFNINDEDVTLYSSDLTSFSQHHPSFILNFSRKSSFGVLQELFHSLPFSLRKRFRAFDNASSGERDFIGILFVNFLFSSFLQDTQELFDSLNPVLSFQFVHRTKHFLCFRVEFLTSFEPKNAFLKLHNSGIVSYDTALLFPNQVSSFVVALQQRGFKTDAGEGFAHNLFNAHLYHYLYYPYIDSNEYKLRSLFSSEQ